MCETDCSNTAVREPVNSSEQTRRLESKLIILVLVAACTSLLYGMIIGFVIVSLPQLKGTLNEISWFASVGGFVAPIGSLIIGVVIDKFGRRSALLWGIAPSIFGWLVIYFSENMTEVLVGRAICGLTMGTLLYPQQVYTAECLLVSHQRWLDSFKIWTGIAGGIGGLFCLLMSFLVGYRELAGVIFLVSILEFTLVFHLLPESPTWLILQNRYGDAEWSQKRLGIRTSSILSSDDGKTSIQMESRFSGSTLRSDFAKIKREDVFKPLTVTIILFILLMAAGPIPVTVYIINIIGNRPATEDSSRSAVDPDEVKTSDSLTFTLVSTSLTVLCNIVLSVVLPYSSVRKTSIPCMFAISAAMGVLAYTTIVQNVNLYMIRVITVCLIVQLHNVGVNNLTAVLLGYIFPSDCKGFASILSGGYILLSAIAIKLYPFLESAFHGYLYYGYALFALLSGIFAFFFLPETVGKSQAEISDGFRRKY